MGDDMTSVRVPFVLIFAVVQLSKSSMVAYLTTIDHSLSLNSNRYHHPLITQLTPRGFCSPTGGRWVWSDAAGKWECLETYPNPQLASFSIRQNKLVGNSYEKLSFIKGKIIQLSRSINLDTNYGNMGCQVSNEGIQN